MITVKETTVGEKAGEIVLPVLDDFAAIDFEAATSRVHAA